MAVESPPSFQQNVDHDPKGRKVLLMDMHVFLQSDSPYKMEEEEKHGHLLRNLSLGCNLED